MRNAEVSRIRGKIFAPANAPARAIEATTRLVPDRADDVHRTPYGSQVRISLARIRFAEPLACSMTVGRPATAREFLSAWGDADALFDAVSRARWWPVEMRAARLKMRAGAR